MVNEEKNHERPSFEEIMADEMIQAELKMLYTTLVLELSEVMGHNIDDWECIIADRMYSLMTKEPMDFMKYARLPFYTGDENV